MESNGNIFLSAEAKPEPPALDPMPTADPQIAAVWLRRMAIGPLLWLIMLPFSFCTILLWMYAPGTREALIIFVYPVFAVVGLVGVWLFTLAEPGDPYWLIYLRWGARAGAVAGIGQTLLPLVAGGFIYLPISTESNLGNTLGTLELVSSAGTFASMWYLARLSARLHDRVLRLNFAALKWIFGVVAVVITIFALADWQAYCEEELQKLTSYSAAGTSSQTPWLGYACLPIFLWFIWLDWRLWRRLRAAARKLLKTNVTTTGERRC